MDALKAIPRRTQLWIVIPLAVVAVAALAYWIGYRYTHSITNDAFVESDMVVLAPKVSGQIVEMLVADSEHVTKGQLLFRIDPIPYREQIALDLANEKKAAADLEVARSALARLESRIPDQIALAQRQLATSNDELLGAEGEVEHARATVQHDLTKAEQNVRIREAERDLALITYKRFEELLATRMASREMRDTKKAALDTAKARLDQAHTELAQARSDAIKVQVSEKARNAARNRVRQAESQLALANLGPIDIVEARHVVESHAQQVEAMRAQRSKHETDLRDTEVVAPFNGVAVKRFQFRGDYATQGVPVLSLYDTDNLYVTANLEETKLAGVGPGNAVRLSVDAFNKPFKGHVLWIGKATGAQFALIPRDVSSGEFTKVVQRVPVRIVIDEDKRWSELRPGLSVTVAISHARPDRTPVATPSAIPEAAAQEEKDTNKETAKP